MNASHSGRRIAAVWLVLVVFSLLSVEGVLSGSLSSVAFVLAMLLACAKAVLIARDFMELAAAPPPWAMLFTGLFIFAAVAVAGLHVAAS